MPGQGASRTSNSGDPGLHDGLSCLVHQGGAHVALAFKARHHLAQGDGVLDIGFERVADRMARAVKGAAHFQVDHGAGVERQQACAHHKRQHQKQRDRADKAVLK